MRSASGPPPGSNPLGWMDPLACDAIAMGYARAKGDATAIAGVVRCHALLWRCVLGGRDDPGAFRRELSRLAGVAGVSEGAIEQVNRDVMAELLDTIAQRFTRSPREAGRLSFEVARAACRIALARPVQDHAAPELALAKRRA
jgi:hypothetical protein